MASSLQFLNNVFKNITGTKNKRRINQVVNDLSKLDKSWGGNPTPASHFWNESLDRDCPTGVRGVAALLGLAGYPSERIVEIFGTESSGKTTMALHAIAASNKLGQTCAFIDIENGLNSEYAKALGVVPEKCLVARPKCAEHAFDALEVLLESKGVSVVVLDSVAALNPKAESHVHSKHGFDGGQARLMSERLRRISSLLVGTGTTLIFVNQLRTHLAEDGERKEVSPGGQALKFYASIRLRLKRGELIEKEGNVLGHTTHVEVVKNRYSNPYRSCTLDLHFGKGIVELPKENKKAVH